MDKKRVLLLVGSITLGWEVDEQDTIAFQLQALLGLWMFERKRFFTHRMHCFASYVLAQST